jgi:hypothetical protein
MLIKNYFKLLKKKKFLLIIKYLHSVPAYNKINKKFEKNKIEFKGKKI